MATSSCLHATQVEEIKRIVGEAMYENEVVGPNGSPVSGGAVGTVPASQIISGTLGSYTADTTYEVAGTAGGVDAGSMVRYSTAVGAWVWDFLRGERVI